MIISQQAREVELSLSTRLGYCLPKRNIHLRPPCLVGFLIPPLQAQGRPFLSIAPYRLTSYKSSSAIRPADLLLIPFDIAFLTGALVAAIVTARARVHRGQQREATRVS